jgi:hypothetical protein
LALISLCAIARGLAAPVDAVKSPVAVLVAALRV